MRPILEDRLVDRQRLVQVLAAVLRIAGPEDVVVAALYDVDRIDLHIAEVLHCPGHRLGSIAERRRLIQPLGPEPDMPGVGLRKRKAGLAA